MSIKQAIEALEAADAVCERIITQDGGILGGVDFHAHRKGTRAALAVLRAMPAELVAQIPDCGEAGHDEGRCGNASCMPGKWGKLLRNARDHAYDEEGYTLHPDLADAVEDVDALFATPHTAPKVVSSNLPVVSTAVLSDAEIEALALAAGIDPEHDDPVIVGRLVRAIERAVRGEKL